MDAQKRKWNAGWSCFVVVVVSKGIPAGVKQVAATQIQSIDGGGSTQTYVAMD